MPRRPSTKVPFQTADVGTMDMDAVAPDRVERVCSVVSVDLSEPIPALSTPDAQAVYLCVLHRGRAIGNRFLPTPGPRYPARWLAEELAWLGNQERAADEIRAAILPPTTPAPARPTASVVVATRDRPAALERCAAALAELSPAPDEIIIVDNADTPGPARDIANAWGLSYVHEPVAGHSRARNRGLSVVTSEVAIFTDDDVEVTPGWVAALLEPFADPLVAASTGLLFPRRLDTRSQVLFEQHAGFVRGFEQRVIDGAAVNPFTAGSVGAGAALAVRADEARRLGGFREHLGGGTPTRSGEDHLLLFELLSAGLRVVYTPAAVAYHTHRETTEELLRQLEGYGTGMYSYLLAALGTRPALLAALSGVRGIGGYSLRRTSAGAIGRTGAMPWPFVQAELRGALAAPAAYARSRREKRTSTPLAVGAPRSTWRDRLLASRDVAALAVTSELPSLSIVVPTRNRRDSVLRLVRDLQAQRYPDERLEIIVSLDGDVDGTREALQSEPWRRPPILTTLADRGRHADHGHGAGLVRNHGVASATNDLLLFLDDDVHPCDDRLLLSHAAAHHRPGTVAVGPCPPRFADESDPLLRLIRSWWVDQTRRLFDAQQLWFTDLTTANVSLERARFAAIGGFADLPRREDWELGYRLLAQGAEITAAPAAAVIHHVAATVSGFLEDARREGAGDARFLDAHPEALGALTAQNWREMSPERRRLAAAQLDDTPVSGQLVRLAAAPALRSLRSVASPARLQRSLSRAAALMYWCGIGDEVGSLDGWRQLWQRAERTHPSGSAPVIDLSRGHVRPPRPRERHDLQVVVHDQVVGLAPAIWGGIPWTADRFLTRVWDRYGWLARPHVWSGPDGTDPATCAAAAIARAGAQR